MLNPIALQKNVVSSFHMVIAHRAKGIASDVSLKEISFSRYSFVNNSPYEVGTLWGDVQLP
jgi:hypothetical protein